MKKWILCIALLTGAVSFNSFGAVVTSSHAPPPAIEPMPGGIDTSWLIFPDVTYRKGLLISCDRWTSTCKDKGYTPQDVLDTKLGKGYQPASISPYLNGYGEQIGVILYYRKAPQ